MGMKVPREEREKTEREIEEKGEERKGKGVRKRGTKREGNKGRRTYLREAVLGEMETEDTKRNKKTERRASREETDRGT